MNFCSGIRIILIFWIFTLIARHYWRVWYSAAGILLQGMIEWCLGAEKGVRGAVAFHLRSFRKPGQIAVVIHVKARISGDT